MADNPVMKPGKTILFLSAVMLFFASSAPEAATVTIDGAFEYQTIDGGGAPFGFEGEPLPIPLEDLAAQVYALGFRVIRQEHGDCLEQTNDDGDPFRYNWTSLNTQFATADNILQASKILKSVHGCWQRCTSPRNSMAG